LGWGLGNGARLLLFKMAAKVKPKETAGADGLAHLANITIGTLVRLQNVNDEKSPDVWNEG